jgi:hypothetical protein
VTKQYEETLVQGRSDGSLDIWISGEHAYYIPSGRPEPVVDIVFRPDGVFFAVVYQTYYLFRIRTDPGSTVFGHSYEGCTVSVDEYLWYDSQKLAVFVHTAFCRNEGTTYIEAWGDKLPGRPGFHNHFMTTGEIVSLTECKVSIQERALRIEYFGPQTPLDTNGTGR